MPTVPVSGNVTETYAISVGQRVGSYRIERLLQEGGMGAVFEAIHPEIGRRAAVKILRPSFARDPEFTTRFLNEARAANLIGHPNIVEIFEFGRLPDETPYIIMEFLAGESLASRMIRDPRPSLANSLEWCRQAAHAMAAAHAKGVIHRDLKPENIFLVPDPVHADGLRVKILDFGIAKLRPENSVTGFSVTKAGTTMGSPVYMAPEQCYGIGEVNDRADVYALGIILYELIAGRPPFIAELPAELLVMQTKSSPPPLGQLVPNLPRAVQSLVHRLLTKAPEKRPSMTEVVAALEGLLQNKKLLATADRRGSPEGKQDQRVAALLGLVTALALVATALLVRWLLLSHSGSPHRPPPSGGPETTSGPGAPEKTKAVATPAALPVQCEINSEPSGVQIVDTESDKLLGVTPIILKLTRNERPLRVVLRRAGYQERIVMLDRTRDVVRSESLIPTPRRSRTPSTGSSTPPSTATPPSTPPPPRTSPGKDGLLAPSL